MARKTLVVTITDEGRDKGKQFLITEMPATQAERWATRALMLMAKSGVDISENVARGGMAGIFIAGIQALAHVSFHEVEPLMAEMMTCVTIYPDPVRNPTFMRALIEDDIEEIATRIKLRTEIFNLHVGFSQPGSPPTTSTPAPTSGAPQRIRTSRRRSGR